MPTMMNTQNILRESYLRSYRDSGVRPIVGKKGPDFQENSISFFVDGSTSRKQSKMKEIERGFSFRQLVELHAVGPKHHRLQERCT